MNVLNKHGLIYWVLFSVTVSFSAQTSQDYRFCFEHWYPYSYIGSDGKYVGESIDLLRKLTKEMSQPASFVELPFARCRESVLAGDIPFILHTDPTEPISRINVPINDWRLTLAVSVDSNLTFSTLKQYDNLKVMIARTYGYPKEVMAFLASNKMKIIHSKFHTNNETQARALFAKLLLGHVDGIVVDRVWADAMREKYSIPFRLLSEDIHVEPQYIGFHPSASDRADELKAKLEHHFKLQNQAKNN